MANESSSLIIHRILTDQTASTWLKHTLETAVQRDIVDVLNDTEVLLSTMKQRYSEATGTQYVTEYERGIQFIEDNLAKWVIAAEAQGDHAGLNGTTSMQVAAARELSNAKMAFAAATGTAVSGMTFNARLKAAMARIQEKAL